MSQTVLKPGFLASIQDLGRHGFQKHGVVVGGAMDSFSMRMANILVGNEESEAVMEITMMGTVLQFEQNTVIALAGGDLAPVIGNKPVPLWRPVFVRGGQTLHFKACRSGCRAYLSVYGGYKVPEVMNSRSTYLRAGIGGYKGRALQTGDRLLFQKSDQSGHPLFRSLQQSNRENPFSAVRWHARGNEWLENTGIRAMKGPEWTGFSGESRKSFWEAEFQISPDADRMGYRLEGPVLSLEQPLELLSEAVSAGTVQVPAGGSPIVLLADRQTTGGYPRIAQVATVSLPALAQAKPGDKIQFQPVSIQEAECLYMKRERYIEKVRQAVLLKEKRAAL